MHRLFARYWFLMGLLLLIPTGFWLGFSLPESGIDQFNRVAGKAMSRGLTGTVLLLMSVTLNTGRLAASLRAPKAVLWAATVNCAVVPLLAWPLVRLQHVPDFAVGLMIVASIPCTMAAASVWTRSAGGNDAVSLLVTMLTNGLCFLITPFWMGLVSRTSVNLSAGDMVVPLLLGAFSPIAFGQILRLVRGIAPFVDVRKALLTNLAQVCMLGQVIWACVTAGPSLRKGIVGGDGWAAAGFVWSCCIALHVTALLIAWFGASWLSVKREDRIAALFSGSQKTLPIGILIATNPQMLGGPTYTFAIFPILMFHSSQLVIDTIVASRIKEDAVPAAV